MAALRLHQNSQPIDQPSNRQNIYLPPGSNANRSNSIRRSNSINSSTNRSNSLRTYSYHPKASYTPGQAGIPNARRYSSLTSSTSLGNFQQAQAVAASTLAQRPKRLSSINSQTSLPKQTLYEENSEEEGETVVTTQTTKVVDSQGRVTSVTTKTIKTLPDGSNIIETTTKNISRSNSRTNSLRANSLLASQRDPNYNLQKIDEDLQDFEYNYELDNQNHADHQYPAANRDHQLDPDLQHNADSLRLNTEQPNSPLRNESLRNNSLRASSINSGTKKLSDSPPKPLKSILKNTARPYFDETEERLTSNGVENNENVPETLPSDHGPSETPVDNHPYKSIGKPLSEPPKLKVPDVPRVQPTSQTIENRVHSPQKSLPHSPTLRQSPSMRQSLRTSPNTKQAPVFRSPNTHTSPPNSKSDMRSLTSPQGSIQFDERVETIPIYDSYSKPKEQDNHDLYSKAMEVAMEKVYGGPKLQNDAGSGSIPETEGIPESVIEKKNKQDKKLEIIGHSGINDNYKYENHHKDFAIHSLRDPENKTLKSVSRKDRAKEEKKQQKEYENQMKQEEKNRKLEMKRQAKEEARMKKEAEKEVKKSSPKRSFFGRRKKDNTDVSTLGSEVSNLSANSPSATANTVSPQQFESPANARDYAYNSPTRNNYSIPEDDVLHPVPEKTIPEQTIPEQTIPEQTIPEIVPEQRAIPEQAEPIPESLPQSKAEESIPLTTPQIEPTIQLEPTEPEPPVKVRGEPVFMEQEPPVEPEPVFEKKGLDEPEIVLERAEGLEDIPETSGIIAEPEDQVDTGVSKVPELEEVGTYSGIPIPILNEVTTDSEIHDDSALATEDEDYLQSPSSKRLEAEQYYEAKSGASETQAAFESPTKGDHDGTILQKSETSDSEQGTYQEPEVTEPVATEMETKEEPVTSEFQPNSNVLASDVSNKEIPERHYNLGDLIKMGKSNDTTEDSFVPPDAHYDSDSDVSSRFSSDLNAALRRITDDKGNQILDPSGEPANEEAIGNGILSNEPKTALDPPSSKSAPVTDSSDDRSPQPSRSTMATKEEFKPNTIGNFDDTIITNKTDKTKTKTKTKKPSKFKSKILKYFVNNYE